MSSFKVVKLGLAMMFVSTHITHQVSAFLPSSVYTSSFPLTTQRHNDDSGHRLATAVFAVDDRQSTREGGNYKRRSRQKKITIAELQEQMRKNPAMFLDGPSKPAKKSRSRRTRRRVDQPKQQYLYKAQREQLMREGKLPIKADEGEGATDSSDDNAAAAAAQLQRIKMMEEYDPIYQARQLGLLPASQHCDAAIDPNEEPRIMGQIKVSDENGSAAMAYVISKPAGWAILGSTGNAGGKTKPSQAATKNSSKSVSKGDDDSEDDDNNSSSSSKKSSSTSKRRKVSIVEGEGKLVSLEFDEADILAMMTPEELAEWKAEGTELFKNRGPVTDDSEYDDSIIDIIRGDFEAVKEMTAKERQEAGIEAEDYDPDDVMDFDEAAILELLTPEEREEMGLLVQPKKVQKKKKISPKKQEPSDKPISQTTLENLKRIEARVSAQTDDASFRSPPRPSVITWLKELKAAEGTPIRGGKFWTAVAGATNVDDSGLVLLCPKASTSNVFIEYTEYVAIIGNGKNLAPAPKGKNTEIPKEFVELDSLSRVRKGRTEDIVQSVKFTILERPSTCSDIVSHAQSQFEDGVRGDPAANPLDRRAPRRLIHCQAISISSLIADEDIELETDEIPVDIRIFDDRRNNHEFSRGSFLGREALRDNPLTTAYREINGAADGFPGWTVDRYGEWLFVQHDGSEYRGPLPSIHGTHTAGVYYLPANPDRSSMGSNKEIRPKLLEGKVAPDFITVSENGVKYLVSLDKDLSTGIFLDQRSHRGWLTRNCGPETRVLNCFAHCGAFSVAAATAGASTVSLDLSKKWLDRVQPQLEANGIDFNERHDCIYGDCFEWLEKLAKRGEKFDIVILDPPSSSVGKKKKRWSVKNDMAELAALAGPLVKKGGYLWTTTNAANLSPFKYAKECKKGLDSVGLQGARLERVQPMPLDFPTIGTQPVKNLVWRMP